MLGPAKKGLSTLISSLKAVSNASVIVMQGAGVSVAAGIPDFRTPETGFYSRAASLGLPEPESVFDMDFFREDPKPFYKIAHELLPGRFHPTPAHFLSTLLEKNGKLLRLYTQNVDGLERAAGVSEDRLVEAHGHFRSARCSFCRREVDLSVFVEHVRKQEPLFCSCGGAVKPDIVFFGEELPNRVWTLMDKDVEACEILIVMGTSLKVFPISQIVENVRRDAKRFLINNEAAGLWKKDSLGPLDTFIQGDCQDVAKAVIDAMGWNEDFLREKRANSTKMI